MRLIIIVTAASLDGCCHVGQEELVRQFGGLEVSVFVRKQVGVEIIDRNFQRKEPHSWCFLHWTVRSSVDCTELWIYNSVQIWIALKCSQIVQKFVLQPAVWSENAAKFWQLNQINRQHALWAEILPQRIAHTDSASKNIMMFHLSNFLTCEKRARCRLMRANLCNPAHLTEIRLPNPCPVRESWICGATEESSGSGIKQLTASFTVWPVGMSGPH